MRVHVIDPGHGSHWLEDAHWSACSYEDGTVEYVTGWTWDDSDRGSGLMPDDFTGERITLTFPRNLVLREEHPEIAPPSESEKRALAGDR